MDTSHSAPLPRAAPPAPLPAAEPQPAVRPPACGHTVGVKVAHDAWLEHLVEGGAEHGEAGAGTADGGGEGCLEGLGEVDFAGFFAEAAVEAGGIGEVEPGPISGADGAIGGVGGVDRDPASFRSKCARWGVVYVHDTGEPVAPVTPATAGTSTAGGTSGGGSAANPATPPA